MTNFDAAIFAARTLARGLIAEEIDAEAIADAYICEAMAAWAAATGRKDQAEKMLEVWTTARDVGGAHAG